MNRMLFNKSNLRSHMEEIAAGLEGENLMNAKQWEIKNIGL